MKATIVSSFGVPPSVQERPDPAPRDGCSVVRTRAAGVNPVDLAIAAGRFYGDLPDPPFVLGAEVVGEVITSNRFAAGTRVWGLAGTGAFAEQVVVPDTRLVPLPDGADDATVAAVGVAGLAGWMSVLDRGGLEPGETVLVLGASGVVGQIAIQAARRGGAGQIVAASRTDAGGARALGLGATRVVKLTGDVTQAHELREACAPGANLVIDMLWSQPLQMALGACAIGARVVQVGNAAGLTATIPGGAMRGGRIDLRGYSVFNESSAALAAALGALLDAVDAGEVRVDIETLPLVESPIALTRLAAGAAGHKLVLIAGT